MKKVLIPIDFSISSEHASKLASKIARITKSEVHLLHIIELPQGFLNISSRSNLSVPENMLYIEKTKEMLFNYEVEFFSKNKNVIRSILFDKPSEGILRYNEKINADLIIMGSIGHTKIEELLIGSNTEKVIQTSKTPVLIVKKDQENFRLKNLVFASEFKERENIDLPLSKLINLTKKFKSNFHLLKINTPSHFENTLISKKKMQSFAEKYSLSKYTINSHNDTSINEGIINFSNDVSGDIIAIESLGRSNLSHLINRSITKYISKTATQPVIIFRT